MGLRSKSPPVNVPQVNSFRGSRPVGVDIGGRTSDPIVHMVGLAGEAHLRLVKRIEARVRCCVPVGMQAERLLDGRRLLSVS